MRIKNVISSLLVQKTTTLGLLRFYYKSWLLRLKEFFYFQFENFYTRKIDENRNRTNVEGIIGNNLNW